MIIHRDQVSLRNVGEIAIVGRPLGAFVDPKRQDKSIDWEEGVYGRYPLSCAALRMPYLNLEMRIVRIQLRHSRDPGSKALQVQGVTVYQTSSFSFQIAIRIELQLIYLNPWPCTTDDVRAR